MDSEEKEERGSGRSQNVVHVLPRSMASVPSFLTGPLERVDPSAGTTQVLVITADPESAVAMAEAALRLTGPAGIEILPVTSARRASRMMAGRPVLAAAGSPVDMRELIRGSHLKLESIQAVILAWADEILAGDADDIEALESIMSELPKDAARIVVTSRSEGRVNAFAERYLRRAHREIPVEEGEAAAPVAVQYLTVIPASRNVSLRRLLDDMDPPSASIIVANDEAEQEVSKALRLLGYGSSNPQVKVSRGTVEPSTYAVILYEAPANRAELTAIADSAPVVIVALVEPREVANLRRVSGGDVKPFTLMAPANGARDRDISIRRELGGILEGGVATREILALEPLLERYDGIEIAAAALRVLERERTLRKAADEARVQREATPRPAAPPAGAFDRGSRGGFERGAREGGRPRPGGDRPSFNRGDRPDRGDRSGPPSRGPRPESSPRHSGPPRGETGRGESSRGDAGRGERRPPSRDGGTRPPRRDH